MKNYLSSLLARVVIKKVVSAFLIASFVLIAPAQSFAEAVSTNTQNTSSQTTTTTDLSSNQSTNQKQNPTNISDTPSTLNDDTSSSIDSTDQTDQNQQTVDENTDDQNLTPIDEPTMDSVSEDADGHRDLSQDVIKKLKLDTDFSSGALNYEFPISVPSGRNRLTPDLKLIYSSQQTDNINLYGYGWSDNIPYIERINKKGVDKLYSENYFNSSLDGELKANDSSTTTESYGPKVDNGSFNKYEYKDNNKWLITDKSGTTYKFGYSTSSQQYDISTSTNIYRWMLEEVRDRNNNFIKYEYYKDSGQIYPYKITYTGNDVTNGVLEVEFLRESRTDIATSSKSKFQVVSKQRVSEIKASINGNWVKKYQLQYATSTNGRRSLLKSITESGQDENSNIISLPSNIFSYQTNSLSKGWSADNTIMTPDDFVNVAGNDKGVRTIDANGDGLTDIVSARYQIIWSTAANGFVVDYFKKTYIQTPLGWSTTTDYITPFIVDLRDRKDLGVRFVDVNGDNLVDTLYGEENANGPYTYLNTGSSWSGENTTWAPVSDFVGNDYGDKGVRLVDINGDGLIDFVQSGLDIYRNPYSNVYLNNGAGWTLNSNWTVPEAMIDNNHRDRGLRFADVNGDGLMDILVGKDDTSFYPSPQNDIEIKKVYINNGSGWIYDPSWVLPETFIGFNSSENRYIDKGLHIDDVNGDHLPDLVANNNGSTFKIYINNGSGWTYDNSWTIDNYEPSTMSFVDDGKDQGARLVDINGDGLVDLMYGREFIGTGTLLNNSKKIDLMTNINSSSGASTTISYKSSTLYKNGSTQLNPSLPLQLDTVEKITVDDGVGNLISNRYIYEGGKYFYNTPYDRKFAGFNSITKIDNASTSIKTYYHQGQASTTDSSNGESTDSWAKIGKPYRVEVADSSGNIYSKTINNWATSTLANGREFVYLAKKTDLTYDGDSDHKDKAEEYSYATSTGNLIQKILWGEVSASNDGTFSDTGTDKYTTTISYASTTSAYVSAPSQDITVDQSSNKIKENKYYYDTLSFGNIDKGNLTKQEQWATSTSYASSSKTYNSYGLVTQDTDPRGKSTTYSYDPYNLYVSTSTNPLSQTTTYLYDYSLGKPKQVTTPNNLVFQTVYDALDRVKEEKQPDLTTPATLVSKAIYTYFDTTMPRSVQKTSYLNAATTTSSLVYTDGLGRTIQERKQAEATSTYSVKDTTYNALGLKYKESLPYFSTGTTTTTATASTSLYTRYSYDPIQRVAAVSNVVGTTTYSYDDWMTHIQDPRSKAKNLYTDAYNNLVKVDEIIATTSYSTQYNYNGLGNLTKITDALGNVRNFTYDGLGRRASAQDLHATADTTFGSTTFAYDDAGNLTQKVDAKNQTVNYTYDDLNRPLTEDYIGAAGTEISYGYDACAYGKGMLCSATTTDAISNYEFNALGLQSKETKRLNSVNYVTQTSYDRQGNIITIIYPDNSQVKYVYNNAGLLEKIQRKESNTSTFSDVITNYDYAPTGAITIQEYGNGAKTTNTYDANELYRLRNKLTYTPDGATDGSGVQSMLRSNMMIQNEESENEGDSLSTQDFLQQVLGNDARNALYVDYDNNAGIHTLSEAEIAFYEAHYTNATSSPQVAGHPESELSLDSESSFTTSSLLSNNPPRESQNMFTEGLWLSENILYNSGFENSFDKWNFYSTGTSTGAQDCTVSYSGSCSAKVVVTSAGNNYDTILYQQFRTDTYANYKVKFKAKASIATTLNVSVNENHSPWYDLGLGKDINVGTSWQSYEYDLSSWDSDENGRIDFGLGAHTGTFWIDDVQIVPDALNKIQNPSFEGSYGQWGFYANGGIASNSTDCTYSTKGDCSNKTTFTSTGANWEAQLNADLTISDGVSDGQTYILAFDAKAASPRSIQAVIGLNYSPYTELTPQVNINLSTTTQKYIVELHTDVADTSTRLSFFMGANSSTVYLDNVHLWRKQNTKINNQTPAFNEIFDDPDDGDLADSYQFQVIKKGGTFSSPLWDSGKTAVSSYFNGDGERLDDFIYTGTPLPKDGSLYYWRVKMWDSSDAEGPWTNGNDYFYMIGKKIQDLTYNYDANGNITSILDNSDTDTEKSTVYTYDDLNRLTSATASSTANSADYTETYDYNAIGNILSKTGQGTYSYNGSSGANYANPHAVTSINGNSYTYDNNGNQLSGNGITNTWDYRNRLTQSTIGSSNVSYGYDSADNRVKYSNGTTTTYYPNKYFNYSTATTTKQIYDANGQLVATVEGSNATSTVHYIHTDHLGGSNVTTNTNGSVDELTDYYPYGSIRLDQKNGSFSEQKKFTGYEYDQDTGLNYAQARYQDPRIGRFISEDPTFLDIGSMEAKKQNVFLADPQQLNSYSYARNNPIINTDPSGKCIEDLCIGEGIAAVSLLSLYAPQITAYAQSLTSNFGIIGISQAMDDAKSGRYGWAAFGFLTSGEIPESAGRYLPTFDGLWTAGKQETKAANAIVHTGDHAAEFGLSNTKDYVNATRNFITDAINKGYDTKVVSGKNVDVLRTFDKTTSTFSAFEVNKSTNAITPRTMFTTTPTYFNNQAGSAINITKYFKK